MRKTHYYKSVYSTSSALGIKTFVHVFIDGRRSPAKSKERQWYSIKVKCGILSLEIYPSVNQRSAKVLQE